MNNDNASAAANGGAQESSRSRTDRIIASAEAMLVAGGHSFAQSDASLKQSRAIASANATADAREPLTRLCMEMAKEMAEANFEPTIQQVKMWREQLLAVAGNPDETPTDG